MAENARLRGQLEEARRAGKRQAAPFSKGDPKQDPARPGRKSGDAYGTRAHRRVPDHVDEEIRVPLPDACPCCSGELEFEDEVDQYQEEIVEVRRHVRRFRISRGRCRRCGKRAQAVTPIRPVTRSERPARSWGRGRSRSPRSSTRSSGWRWPRSVRSSCCSA